MKNTRQWVYLGAAAVAGLVVGIGLHASGAFDGLRSDTRSERTAPAPPPTAPEAVSVQPGASNDVPGDPPRAELTPPAAATGTPVVFQPPPESEIPAGGFGDVVRRGREIFVDTPRAAPAFVGNSLRCVSCHLDAGRLADSSPMWAAFVSYPAYRSKNKSVNTFQQRLQGCFEYSMNGKAPPLGAPELVALESYSYWLASGAPINPNLVGRGYPALARPALAADFARGEQVYAQNCVLCHGADGGGQNAPDGTAVFPALWGPNSFNWGAGMGRINNAAAFVKANMPLGLPGTLSDQQAWDVALYMNSHERPQDPRYSGSVQATRTAFHATEESMYGREVAGQMLGDSGPPKPFKPFKPVKSLQRN